MSVALLVRLPGRSESLSILSQSGIVKFSDDLHLDYLPKTDISTAELEALSVFSSVGYTVTIKE
ncbi:MAG: hypothetical protein KAH32_05950 [Chlamydiia bacterium]|nr:hypothetical protein [Chlamydiia bacterium]